MHDGIAVPLSICADILQLLLNGYVPLAGGGIAGIGDGRMRRTGNKFLFHNQSEALSDRITQREQILIVFFLSDITGIKKFFYSRLMNISSTFTGAG